MKVKLFYSDLDNLCKEIIDILTESELISKFDLINIFQDDKIIPNLPPELKFTPAIITEDVKYVMCGHDAVVYIKSYCNTNLKTNNINTVHITNKFDKIIDDYKGTKGVNMDFSKLSMDFRYLIEKENENIKSSSMVNLDKIGKEIIDMKKINNEIQNDGDDDETKRITLIDKEERTGEGDIDEKIKQKMSKLKNKIKVKTDDNNEKKKEKENKKSKIKIKKNDTDTDTDDNHKSKKKFKIKKKDKDDESDNESDKEPQKIKFKQKIKKRKDNDNSDSENDSDNEPSKRIVIKRK